MIRIITYFAKFYVSLVLFDGFDSALDILQSQTPTITEGKYHRIERKGKAGIKL